MGRGLESIKPSLDWNVEKDGAKEVKYHKDSYDYLFSEEELEAFRLEDDVDRWVLEATREPSDGISKAIAESEMSDEELMALWGKDDLGKYTINAPTQEKVEERMEERGMQVFDEEEFKRAVEEFEKSLEEGDPIREETNAQINRIMQQMELDW